MVDAVVGRQAATQLCLSLAKLMQQFHKYSHQKESALCQPHFFLLCADQCVFARQPSESKRDVTCDTTAACVLSCHLTLFR